MRRPCNPLSAADGALRAAGSGAFPRPPAEQVLPGTQQPCWTRRMPGQRRPANRSSSGTGVPVVSRTRTKVSTPISSRNRSRPNRRNTMLSL